MTRDYGYMDRVASSLNADGPPWVDIKAGDHYFRMIAPKPWPRPFTEVRMHRYGQNPNKRGNTYYFPCPLSLGVSSCPICEAGPAFLAAGRADEAEVCKTDRRFVTWCLPVVYQNEQFYLPSDAQLHRMEMKQATIKEINKVSKAPLRHDVYDPEKGAVLHINRVGTGFTDTEYSPTALIALPAAIFPVPPELYQEIASVGTIEESKIQTAPKLEDLQFLLQNGHFPQRDQATSAPTPPPAHAAGTPPPSTSAQHAPPPQAGGHVPLPGMTPPPQQQQQQQQPPPQGYQSPPPQQHQQLPPQQPAPVNGGAIVKPPGAPRCFGKEYDGNDDTCQGCDVRGPCYEVVAGQVAPQAQGNPPPQQQQLPPTQQGGYAPPPGAPAPPIPQQGGQQQLSQEGQTASDRLSAWKQTDKT